MKPDLRPQNQCFSSGPCAKRPGWSPAALQNALVGRSHRSKSGRARGHLVRRLDPMWGTRWKEASEDTFHFTNAAPQHKNLNQRTWQNLEDYIATKRGKM